MNLLPYRIQFSGIGVEKPEDASFIIIPLPYEQTTSYGKGTKYGPSKIIDASLQIELWDEELKKENYRAGIFTADSLKYVKSEKDFFTKGQRLIEMIVESYNSVFVFIGGEHSISQVLIPPFARKYKNLSVLHFDAHADLRKEYEGTPHSHACAMYPISKIAKIVQIGIRNVALEEAELINNGNVKTYLMHENLDTDRLVKKIMKDLSDNVYITIDVDGFDPSVMPATGTPQPGGFMWYDAVKIFREVCFKKNVVAFDVVETSPVKGFNITEFNAAKLIYKLIGYISVRKGLI